MVCRLEAPRSKVGTWRPTGGNAGALAGGGTDGGSKGGGDAVSLWGWGKQAGQ